MRFFPIFLDLEHQPVLVIGGGEQAAQKVRLLRRTGARITVLAEEPGPEIAALATAGDLALERRRVAARDLVGVRLAYVALEDGGEAARAVQMARAAGVPVNVVDRQELCDFLTPAIVDRDPVVVAIGTEGAAPVLARRIKAQLEAMLPARLGGLARWAASLRGRVAEAIRAGAARRRFWDGFFDGPIARAYLAGRHEAAARLVETELDGAGAEPAPTGSVTLVGAGPGDPDLLTFKAMRALQTADVIVVDRLVPQAILDCARRDAARIHVGKAPGKPSPSQSAINAILVREAEAGKHVVRLKGGDPFVFGRGGEELAALAEAGIPVEVIPGITAAIGCAAAVGLALTEREQRRSLTLLTGRASDGPAEHDWQALARPGRMLAIYMGTGAAGHVQSRLLAGGIDPATPVTVVENGTLPGQKVATGVIVGLAELVIDAGIKGPAIIYVGAHPCPARTAAAGEERGRAVRALASSRPIGEQAA
ncbi:siroheme synthase CysG [Benzoatithermus flavus]|uniref:Siroheme synthase CysG n=1 Tax=Benzoatithermus flavus TaxID=3108223 RepID=A0ABU8XTF8_9PROT